MTGHRMAQVAFGAVAGMLAVLAGLIIDPSAHVVDADTDVDESVNFIDMEHIARNIIVGETITVCTADYPNTTEAAAEMWNSNLNNDERAFIASDENVFAVADLCPGRTDHDQIAYVEIDSRDPEGNDFFCPRDDDLGCFLVPPRSGQPHHTYTGRLLVIMNGEKHPPGHDDLAEDALEYKELRRTVAHELGHTLGLGDRPIPSDPPREDPCDPVEDSLMYCHIPTPENSSDISSPYPLKPIDFADYEAIYKPNIVTGPQSPVVPVLVTAVRGRTGMIVVTFDASKVVTEEQIELRRWTGTEWAGGERAGEPVATFPPESGLVLRVIAGQLPGMQKYRIFSTTQALIAGQCAIDDEDCDGSTSGTPIGFGTGAETVDVRAVGPRGYVLTTETTGPGTVTRKPDHHAYSFGDEVELEAHPDTYRDVIALSTFAGWGEDAPLNCGTNLTCPIDMDGDKTVTARFVPITYTLEIKPMLDPTSSSGAVATGQSYHPAAGSHTYNAGTVVRVYAGWDPDKYAFERWKGCTSVSPADGHCEVYMNEDKTGDNGVQAVLRGPPRLGGLTVTGSDFTFSPDTTEYSVGIDSALSQTTLTVHKNHSEANINLTTPRDAVPTTPQDTDPLTSEFDVTLPWASQSQVQGSGAVGASAPTATTQDVEVLVKLHRLSNTYTLELTPRDVRLRDLTLSGVTFSFDPATTEYAVTVASDVAQTKVAPTLQDPNATAEIMPADADTLTDGHQVDLAPAETTTITIKVTYLGALRVYTVAVERPHPAVTISGGDPVTEGTAAEFTLTREGDTTAALDVTVSVDETGDMMSGTKPRTETVTIEAGSATGTLTVDTVNDNMEESDSEVTATITRSDNSPYTLGTPSAASVTVQDDDGDATVMIAAGTSPITEGTAAEFTVTREGDTTAALGVTVSMDETGDMMRGTKPRTATVTIVVGATDETLSVGTVDDSTDEPDSIVTATVQDGTGYTAGTSGASASVTVEDDDPNVMGRIRARTLSNGKVEFEFRTKDGVSIAPTPLRFVTPSEMVVGRWYNSSAFEVTLDGVTYTVGKISARLDNDQCPHVIVVALRPHGGGDRIDPSGNRYNYRRRAENTWARSSQITIPLSAQATGAVGAASWSMEAAGAGYVATPGTAGGTMLDQAAGGGVTGAAAAPALCAPLDVAVSTRTATSLTLTWDAVPEATGHQVKRNATGTELTATGGSHPFTGLTPATSYTLYVRSTRGSEQSAWASVTETTLFTVTISGGSSVTEGTAAEFTVTRDGDTSDALTVTVSVSETGSMISGSAPTSATILAGSATHTFSVATVDDNTDEPDSTITATVQSGTGYTVGTSASVTVKDNDCTLTVTAGTGGTATGGGTSTCGSSRTATATANAGYRFSHWSGDSTSTSASISVTLNGDKSVHANFIKRCTLTVTAGTGGSASGGGEVDCGDSRTATATANAGYRFDRWSGASTSTSASVTIRLNENKSVRANFIKQCTLTVTAGTGGSASGGGTSDCGASRTATATANAGYRFDRWSGASTSTSASVTIRLNENKSVRANFIKQCTLTVTAGTGGSASGGGTSDCGASRTATATANAGYHFTNWSGASSSTSSSVSITLNVDKSVHANFAADCAPDQSTKPKASQALTTTYTRWVVRDMTAYEQSRTSTQWQVRSVTWSGEPECEWETSDWFNFGNPVWTDWADTDTPPIPKPPDGTDIVNTPAGTGTRWVSDEVFGFCVEFEEQRPIYWTTISPYTWNWSAPNWVKVVSPPLFQGTTYGDWSRTGKSRLCGSGQSDGASGAAAASATLAAGDYTLPWGLQRISFTVPAGASVQMSLRTLDSGVVAAVLRSAAGAELVLYPGALADGARPSPSAADATLSSIAATLALTTVEPVVPPTAPASEACAVVTAAATGATAVDMDASRCADVPTGALAVSLGAHTLSLTLPTGYDWLLLRVSPDPAVLGIIDMASGAYLALNAATGAEQSREVGEDVSATIGPIFDTIVTSVQRSDAPAGRGARGSAGQADTRSADPQIGGTPTRGKEPATGTASTSEARPCAAVASDGSAAAIDLTAGGCASVAAGGPVQITVGGDALSLTLPADRDWDVALVGATDGSGADWVVLLDTASMSFLLLDPATGTEVERRIPDDAQAGIDALFDAIIQSAQPPPDDSS